MLQKEILEKLENSEMIIFDFDGTMVNSEKYHFLTYNLILSKVSDNKISISQKDYVENYCGHSTENNLKALKERFNLTQLNIKKELKNYRKYIMKVQKENGVKFFDYVLPVLEQFKHKNFCIVSSGFKKQVLYVLKKNKVDKLFKQKFFMEKLKIKKSYFYSHLTDFLPNIKNVCVFEDNYSVVKHIETIIPETTTIGIETEFNKGLLTYSDFIIKIN